MTKKVIFLFFIFFGIGNILAQSKLKIVPDQIHFKDVFHRLENVLLINDGDSTLVIDSIYYRKNIYYVRFNYLWQYPLVLAPHDTAKMDCILSRYNLVSYADTSDTMFVYYRGYDEVEKIRIKIDFYKDSIRQGLIRGKVSATDAALNNMKIYFFQDGRYLVDSSETDENGNYSKNLPVGNYTAAANKIGYHLTFYNQKYDPFSSNIISLAEDSVKEINFNLIPDSVSGYSISGKIFDTTPYSPMKRAIVVIRKGIHNPVNKYSAKTPEFIQDGIYSAMINSYEDYKVNVSQPGYYFVQVFSDYYLPGYYSSSNIPSIFWQGADSVLIDRQITNKNVVLNRDSSFGGGTINGLIKYDGGYSGNPGEVTILAKLADNDSYINYTDLTGEGTFHISELPYGKYQIIAQKIDFEDAASSSITIDSLNTSSDGILLQFKSPETTNNFKPDKIKLYQNYPNPFNPTTTIHFYLPERTFVKVEITSILGEKITELFSGYLEEGNQKFLFNGSNLSSGVYLVSLNAAGMQLVRKILLLK